MPGRGSCAKWTAAVAVIGVIATVGTLWTRDVQSSGAFTPIGRPAAGPGGSSASSELVTPAAQLAPSLSGTASSPGLPVHPDDPAWRNSIAICTAIRDENVTDVREWLAYHRWLGIDHAHIVENDSASPIKDGIQDFIDSGFLTYRTRSGYNALLQTFEECFLEGRHLFNWMAFMDVDEILILREKNTTLAAFLDEFKHEAGLMVHWIRVGPNHRLHRPPKGGMLRHYTTCDDVPNPSGKLIANLYYMAGVGNLHTARFRRRRAPVDERHTRYKYFKNKSFPSNKLEPAYADRIALFHYITKSRHDFNIKIMRGNGAEGRGHQWHHFYAMQNYTMHSGDICAEPAALADLCCPETAD